MRAVTFSEKYRAPIKCAVILSLLLFLMVCVFIPDMGESMQALGVSMGVFIILLLMIMINRPATPSKLDLLLISWGMPVIFLTFLFGLPLVWHLRRLQ